MDAAWRWARSRSLWTSVTPLPPSPSRLTLYTLLEHSMHFCFHLNYGGHLYFRKPGLRRQGNVEPGRGGVRGAGGALGWSPRRRLPLVVFPELVSDCETGGGDHV